MDALGIETVVAFLNSRDERRFGDHAGEAERDQLATPTSSSAGSSPATCSTHVLA
jgi:hypothetical protein